MDPNRQKTAEEYFEEGLAYFDANKYNEAIEPFKQAVRLKPDYAFAFGFLSLSYHQLGRNDDAIEALKRATQLDPSSGAFHGQPKRYLDNHEARKYWFVSFGKTR